MDVLAVSGGLDSTCLWPILGKPRALFVHGVNRGPANAGELAAVYRQMEIDPVFRERLTIVSGDFQAFFSPTHPRGGPRENIVAQIAWAQGYSGVAFAYCGEDGCDDEWEARARSRIWHAAGMMNVREPDEGMDAKFPARNIFKRELIKLALDAGASMEFLKASHSCLVSAKHCGECQNCRHRIRAFKGLS